MTEPPDSINYTLFPFTFSDFFDNVASSCSALSKGVYKSRFSLKGVQCFTKGMYLLTCIQQVRDQEAIMGSIPGKLWHVSKADLSKAYVITVHTLSYTCGHIHIFAFIHKNIGTHAGTRRALCNWPVARSHTTLRHRPRSKGMNNVAYE